MGNSGQLAPLKLMQFCMAMLNLKGVSYLALLCGKLAPVYITDFTAYLTKIFKKDSTESQACKK